MGGGGNLGIRIIGGIEGGGPNPAMGPGGRGGCDDPSVLSWPKESTLSMGF